MSKDSYVSRPPPSSVLTAYFPLDQIGPLQSLGNAGGFSGTRFWRFVAHDTQWCLRRWPTEHPTVEKLAWIHRVLLLSADHGVHVLPVPRKRVDGRTFCQMGEHLWEVSPWLPGSASYWSEPNDEKLTAVMTSLAQFHRASSRLVSRQTGPAPGLVARQQQLVRWRQEKSPIRLENTSHAEIAKLAAEALQIMPTLYERCTAGLNQAVQISVDWQPCIRDIWHDHALFVDSTLTGIVDFGAMRIDSVVVDVARLLGSLVEDDRRAWQIGLAAYEQVRPLSAEEKSLLATTDLANVILSAANWIRWLFLEQRRFEEMRRVHRRIERIVGRLRSLAVVGL